MKKYNVIIAGAGLAGLNLAKELAGSGLSVLVIDRKKSAGEVRYYSSGTFINVDESGIPGEFLHAIDKAVFCSKNISCTKNISGCYVIDRVKLYNWMESAALKDENIKIRYGCEVKSAGYRHGRITGISYLDHGRQVEAIADIYVDCTGTAAVLGRKAGLTPKKSVMALGVEHLVPLKDDLRTVFLYTGGNLGGGYGWVFPNSRQQAITGVGLIKPKLFHKINEIFAEMWNKRNISGICKHRSIAKNFAALRTGRPLGRFVIGNIMILGDSAHQASPLLGEGIRFILDASTEAAASIKQAFLSGDLKRIHTYGRAWRKKHYKNFKFLYFIQKIMKVVSMNDFIMDKGVRVLRCCNERQYRRVLSGDIDFGFLLFIAVDAWYQIKILKNRI